MTAVRNPATAARLVGPLCLLACLAADAEEVPTLGFERAPAAVETTAAAGECGILADTRPQAADPAALRAAQRAVQLAVAAAPADCLPAARAALRALRHLGDDRHERLPRGMTILQAIERHHAEFEFRPGDVLLLRSPQLVSAAVSQIGTQPTDFSHAALVGYDPVWRTLDVVEALAGEGVRTVPLEDWLDKPFVRFAVFRFEDARIAEKAAVLAYRDAAERVADDLYYDFRLLLREHTRLYCTEVVTRAFELADPAAAPVPRYVSDVGRLIETFPLKELGAASPQVFLADDIELDARFTAALELRVPAALTETDALDARFREIFARLRGPEREAMLAEIDAAIPPGPLAIAYAFGGGYFEYQRLPEASRPRIAGLARLVDRSLESQVAATQTQ